jgi:hypothetical protein
MDEHRQSVCEADKAYNNDEVVSYAAGQGPPID